MVMEKLKNRNGSVAWPVLHSYRETELRWFLQKSAKVIGKQCNDTFIVISFPPGINYPLFPEK
jgi:hypothetical protein